MAGHTSLNEKVVFVFVEGDGTGLPGSPSMCACVSLPLYLSLRIIADQISKKHKKIVLQHIRCMLISSSIPQHLLTAIS